MRTSGQEGKKSGRENRGHFDSPLSQADPKQDGSSKNGFYLRQYGQAIDRSLFLPSLIYFLPRSRGMDELIK